MQVFSEPHAQSPVGIRTAKCTEAFALDVDELLPGEKLSIEKPDCWFFLVKDTFVHDGLGHEDQISARSAPPCLQDFAQRQVVSSSRDGLGDAAAERCHMELQHKGLRAGMDEGSAPSCDGIGVSNDVPCSFANSGS